MLCRPAQPRDSPQQACSVGQGPHRAVVVSRASVRWNRCLQQMHEMRKFQGIAKRLCAPFPSDVASMAHA